MTKEVWIAVKGLQDEPQTGEEVQEIIVAGEYYFRKGRHFVIYDEIMEGMTESSHNIIRFRQDYMELTRKGPYGTHMVFEKEKQNVTYYDTPFGSLTIGVNGKKIHVWEEESKIEVDVEYELDMNYEKVADCRIQIKISPRKQKDFTL